jgi:hypothetical protein
MKPLVVFAQRKDNPPGHGVWLFALMESPVGLIVWLAAELVSD